MKDITEIPVSQLRPFEGHPYKVLDNEEMDELTGSICSQGILSPLIVRPLEDTVGEYEVVSGHRRLHAAVRAGLETVPAFVREMDRDTAVITLVDSNLSREHILPSEKAFAYRMKLEALSRQGQRSDLTSDQLGRKLETAEIIGEYADDSKSQVRRYIRLTLLIPEILKMVDEKRIAFTPAVELSYLTEDEQRSLLELMESEERTPSLSQAQRMKRLSAEGRLDENVIYAIITEDKPNQIERIRLPAEKIRGYFPESYTPQQMEDVIVRLLENWHRQQQRKKNDAR